MRTSSKSWDDGIAWMKDAGRRDRRDQPAAHQICAARLLHHRAGGSLVSNLARYDGVRYGLRDLPEGAGLQDMYAATRAAGFGDEVKRRIIIGTYVLSAGFYDAYYTQAQKVRTLIATDFKNAFDHLRRDPGADHADCQLSRWATRSDDPLAMYLNDVFSVPASLAGLPAMCCSGRAEQRRPAARTADHRQCVR